MAEPFFTTGKGPVLATGLKWFPLKGASKRGKTRFKRDLAKRLGFDLEVGLKELDQVGFARTTDGFKAGMVSMAAVVRDAIMRETQSATFQCAFCLAGDTWGYLAVRQGLIVPSTAAFKNDFLGSEAEVKAQFEAARGAGWDVEVTPDAWQLAGTLAMDVDALIPRQKEGRIKAARGHILGRILTSGDVAKRILLVALMGVLAGGTYLYWQHQEAKKAEEARQQAALAAQKKVDMKPWKKIPTATAFVQTCQQTFNRLPDLFVDGWTFHSALCSGNKLSIVWNRDVNGLPEQMTKAQPKASVAPNGNKAELVLPLAMETGSDDPVGLLSERRSVMVNAALKGHIPLTFKEKGTVEKKGAKPKGAGVPIKSANFTIKDMDVLPFKAIDALDGPGFRINHMLIKMKDGLFTWSLEGTQYGH